LIPAAEARAQFGSRLRQLRENSGLTGRDFAARIGWAASKVSRLEHGKQTATPQDVTIWAEAVGAASDTRDALLAELQQMRFEYAAWRRQLQRGTATRQRANMSLDATTQRVRAFEPDIIPGLLQTAEYARHILSHVVAFDGIPNDVEEGVRTRLRRQEILYDRGKQFRFLVAEAALRYRICPLPVLRGQLDRLVTLAGLDNIELAILPLNVELPVLMLEGFWIYDEQLVRVETLSAELSFREPYDVERYARAFEALWSVTLQSRAMVAMIARIGRMLDEDDRPTAS
jgi:transcriptional regulator with XRE-family HTH domain